MHIVLAAGKHERIEGAMHQDIRPFEGIGHVFDLNADFWPIDFENLFDKVTANHIVEHLKDLIHFMDKCHFMIKPNGTLEIETPNAGMNPDLTNCDPSHVMCYRPHTFINYFTPEGIEKFGYTDKAWKIEVSTFQLEVPDDCIKVIATPIK